MDPKNDKACWAQLVLICADLSSLRYAIDLKQLQDKVQAANLPIKAARSYRDDIQRLQALSTEALRSLSYLAKIEFNGKEVRIERDVTKVLDAAAKQQSLLLIGEPGSGKSGALHGLAANLLAEECDVVYLAADRLEAGSLGSLRVELGLSHEVGDVLENWRSDKCGVLLVDALDAARAEPSARALRDLLRRVASIDRWRVVASVRKFDLRYSPEIQTVFGGRPPIGPFDSEFSDVRHLLVQRLSDAELGQIAKQAPALHSALQRVPSELPRIIFNLRILSELINHGIDVQAESPVRTQLDLLELYWKYRVLDGPARDAREHILWLAAQSMLRNRSMRAGRTEVSGDTPSAELHELLSRGVLIEWQTSAAVDRNKLAFAHHVVFDFAVSTLVFRGDDNIFAKTLESDPQIVLIARPSIVFHYHHVWNICAPDLRRFWAIVFRMQSGDSLPTIGKLIGPSVAADRTQSIDDFEGLLEQLRGDGGGQRTVAEQVLGNMVGAVIAERRSVAGPDAGPWCALALEVSSFLSPHTAYSVRALLSLAVEHEEALTNPQLVASGTASRNLLEYAWSQAVRDQVLVVSSIEDVCKTFRSDSGASAGLLRRALEPIHLSQFGYAELPWLARQLSSVAREDPSFVEDVYRAAFGYTEPSTEPVPMGTSRLLALTSTRRQDFEGARWELGRFFATFMIVDEVRATSALIACVDFYVINERMRGTIAGEATPKVAEFELCGARARISGDYSGIWDGSGVDHHDDVITMLDSFADSLKKGSEMEDGAERLKRILDTVIKNNKWAVLWRRILLAGSHDPTRFGTLVRELGWAEPVLSGFDTSWAAGEFLRAVFPSLDSSDRERTERAIIGIGQIGDQDKQEAREKVRDRLLCCLPPEELVLDETRAIVGRLSAAGKAPSNEPPFKMEFSSSAFGEKEYLEELGVAVDSDENRWMRDLEGPVKVFADKYLNSEPTVEDLQNVEGPLGALWRALGIAEAKGVHQKQSEYAWDTIAEAASRIPSAKSLSCAEPLAILARTILLGASVHPCPEPDAESDARFDESPAWGGPAARIAAAAGLIRLCRHRSCVNSELLHAVERLANDPVPAVRYQIGCYLNALYENAPELMWRLTEFMAREDSSRGVVQGLLVGSLQALVRANPARAVPSVLVILDRIRNGPGAQRARESALEILAGLYIWRGNELAQQRINLIVEGEEETGDDPRHVLVHVRQAMTYGAVGTAEEETAQIRGRAFDLVRRLLATAVSRINELESRGTPFQTWPAEDQLSARKATEIVDDIGREIYFASGAFIGQGGEAESLAPAQRQRFYTEAAGVIDLLCDCGIATVTHHLLQALETMVSFDPRGVFIRIGRVIQGGKRGGYQYESMAADLAVRLIERFIAEQRSLLVSDDECRRVLIAVLDAFVAAGWPAALRLSYRLEDIFR